MKLLIITQKIDREDPVLGFFHNWILELSKKIENISVICLEKGKYEFPERIKVFSLGKESGKSKIKYVKIFLNLILGLNREYDAVFVHMNQEYILLGGLFWKIMGKKIYFWRNHARGNLLTMVAVWLSNIVFCTSSQSFTAKFKKTVIMPVGIDTEKLKVEKEQLSRKKNSILFLSRISPIKRPDLLVEALGILNARNINFETDFYGDPLPKDQDYYDSLKSRVAELGLDKKVYFYKGVPNYKTLNIYKKHDIFVNLTPTGSMDKTIFEAAACGCIPVIANRSLQGEIDDSMVIKEETPGETAEKIEFWLNATENFRKVASDRLQEYVLKNHSLNVLLEKFVNYLG